MNSNTHVFMITTVFCAIATGALGATPNVISNGLVEIRIDAERGRVDVIDLKRNQPIISNSQIGFSIAPYVELANVAQDAFETEQKSSETKSANCVNTVNSEGTLKNASSKSKSISMISHKAGQGQLQVQFTLYPGKTFVDISFAFKNLNKQPVRLRRVDVIDCERFMPGCDSTSLQLLNGDSGARRTKVVNGQNMKAENNILCFFADQKQPRSLVAGGLTYADYRKYVEVNKKTIVMYAYDPVGKRVDPGQTYKSADRFYLDGITDNPFESLEAYAVCSQNAHGIDLNYYTFPSTCMWFLSVTHFGGDTGSTNNTVGAVLETEHIANSGFLKYCPVAVRLVPDCYEQNNQQGWWDDKHWQMHGRKERCVVERHYEKPYETTQKWATAVKELGGIPLTYFQPGIRSEDYARTFPSHMLYNQSNKYIKRDGKIVSDPHSVMGKRGIPDLINPGKWFPGYGKLWQETYDYTDPDFLKHWTEVNQSLKTGGVQGVFYDYPDRAFAARGGFEDRYATATHAYRNVFRIARQQQGKNAYLQERIGPGSDATLEFVSSVRTAGDNNTITPGRVNQVAMRWYKNRRLTNYDMDGKALVQSGHGKNIHKIEAVERRAILTLSYAVSGRLLLTESFRLFSDEVLHDLSRVYPFHATTLSARPLDAFIRSQPTIFDFPISDNWHQLVLYNGPKNDREFEIPISGDTAFGAMGLDADSQYYIYDFWDDSFVGKVSGNVSIEQVVPAGEAKMLSIHAVENHPQWISTDRHVMQGYVDLVKKPQWNAAEYTLSGTSSVIGGEAYRITLALNGYTPKKVTANGASADITIRAGNKNLADLVLKVKEKQEVVWTIAFSSEANYDEAKIPKYTLPDPLTMADGTKVVSPEQWRLKWRGEILGLFKKHVYGAMPPAVSVAHVERHSFIDNALAGKARLLQETLYFRKDRSGPKVDVCVFLPLKSKKVDGYPAFLALNFFGNHTIHTDPNIRMYSGYARLKFERGGRGSRWAIEDIVSRGYALVTACYNNFDIDNREQGLRFDDGVHQLYPEYQGRSDNWASIGAWAWGMSRILDYLENLEFVDAKRVVAMGHSRLGKTALWAGATDERFALVISNNSGCGGAALARRRFGESVWRINTSFPHWFCAKHKEYNDNENAMPVDQHMLISLIAPRPVYVASAIEDRWADPRGEFLSCVGADPVYKLLNTSGLPGHEWPKVETPVVGRIGYHLRNGKHDVTEYDWAQYLDFADKYMK